MARFFPDSIKLTATAGEKRVLRVLREVLQDEPDWIVWFEPQILPRKTDFIVWSPQLGILLLEVKDYSPGYVVTTNPETWFLRGGVARKNPALQAWEVKCLLLDVLKARPALRSAHPKRAGECAFPVNHAVVLARMTHAQAQQTNCLPSLPKDCGLFFQDDLAHDFSTAAERAWFRNRLANERRYTSPVELHPEDVVELQDVLFPIHHNPGAGGFDVLGFVRTCWAGRFGVRRGLCVLWIVLRFFGRLLPSTRRPRRRSRRKRDWVTVAWLLAVLFALQVGWQHRRFPRIARVPSTRGMSLTITPAKVHAGQRAVLRWSASTVAQVVLDGRPVGANGVEFLFPTTSQVHRLLVYQPNGTIVRAESTLTVIGRQPPAASR